MLRNGGLEVVWVVWRVTRRTGVNAGLSFRPSHCVSLHTVSIPNAHECSTTQLPAHVQVIVALHGICFVLLTHQAMPPSPNAGPHYPCPPTLPSPPNTTSASPSHRTCSKLKFCGGRTDASDADGTEFLGPRQYSNPIIEAVDVAKVMGMSAREFVALHVSRERLGLSV